MPSSGSSTKRRVSRIQRLLVVVGLMLVNGLAAVWIAPSSAVADQFSEEPRLELALNPMESESAFSELIDFQFTSSKIPARAQGRQLELTVTANEYAADFDAGVTIARLQPGEGWKPIDAAEGEIGSPKKFTVSLDTEESLELIGNHLLVIADLIPPEPALQSLRITATLTLDGTTVLDEFTETVRTLAWYKKGGVSTPSTNTEAKNGPILLQRMVSDGGSSGNGQLAVTIEAGPLASRGAAPAIVAYRAPLETELDCDTLEVQVGSRVFLRADDELESSCYERDMLINFSSATFADLKAPIEPVLTVRADLASSSTVLGYGRAVIVDPENGYTRLESSLPRPTPSPTSTSPEPERTPVPPTTASTSSSPAPASTPETAPSEAATGSALLWPALGGTVLVGALIGTFAIARHRRGQRDP